MMIKGSIQEDIEIIDIYAPNTEASQYVRQMLASMIPLAFTLFGVLFCFVFKFINLFCISYLENIL